MVLTISQDAIISVLSDVDVDVDGHPSPITLRW
jgi:hypothetical protein